MNNNLEVANNPNYKVDLKDKFLREFTKSNLAWNKANTFIDEIIKNDSLSSSSFLEKKIQEFKAKNDKFKNFDEKTINIFDLKRAISKEANRLENSRANYLQYTFSKYNLDENQRKKIENEIKNKKYFELERFINSEIENKKFLEKTLKTKVDKISDFKVLEMLTEDEIKQRLSKIREEDKHFVKLALANLNAFQAHDSDIKILFSSWFLKDSEKKDLLSQFIPYLSLSQAVEIWLMSESQANELKEKILKKQLKNIDSLNDSQIQELIKYGSLDDIKIESEKFFSELKNLDLIAENIWFANLENDLKKWVEMAKEELKAKWPQNLKELKLALKAYPRLWWIEKFNKGSILKIEETLESWDKLIRYLEIVDIDEKNKEISYREIWNNFEKQEVINLTDNSTPHKLSFVEFVEVFKKDALFSEFYTKDDIKSFIYDPNNPLKASNLDLVSKENLDENLTQEIKNEYKINLENDLISLQKDLEQINWEIETIEQRIENEKNKKFEWLKDKALEKAKKDSKKEIVILEKQLSNLKAKKDLLESKIKEKQEEIWDIDNLSWDLLASFSNKNKLINKLDELDPEGKDLWFKKWMYIKATDGEAKWWLYEIDWIDLDNEEIILKFRNEAWGYSTQKLSFSSFYEAFKKNKAKRIKNYSSFEDVILEMQKENDDWKNVEFSSGKLIEKNAWVDNKDLEVEYLVAKDDIIKIHKISGDKIEFSYWKKLEWKDIQKEVEKNPKLASKYKNLLVKDKDWKEEYKWVSLEISKEKHILDLNEFENYILQKKDSKDTSYKPDAKLWKAPWEIETEQEKSLFEKEAKWNFMTAWFNMFSFWELVSGGKLMIEWIEEYFKKWNDLHAAKVALAMWKMLPEEVQSDLLIKVERSEEEAMNKEIEALWKVDSWIATRRIRKWLLDKDTPEYKKEAGLMFVLSKYGTLTGKSALYEFKGKYLWYEAFWWKIWDELFNQVKAEAEASDPPQAFSEEFLMYVLINKQSKWILKPKRRSRLYKDFDWKWKAWIKDEVEKWYNDASSKRTAEDMVKWWNSELLGWTLPNAIGWYKRAIERWWTLEDMSEWFFLMLFSWALYTTDQAVYTPYIKTLWDSWWMPQIMARMSSTIPDMKLFNKMVVALSEEIENKEPTKYSWMASEARWIYLRALNNEWTEKERIQDAKKFWDKYWRVLSRAINTVNGNLKDDEKFNSTDKILLEKKFENPKLYSGEKRENLEVMQKYQSLAESYAEEWTFKEDFMSDAMGHEWVGGLNVLQMTKQYLKLDQGWAFRQWKPAAVFWKRVSKDIERQKDKKVMMYMLRQLFAWFLINHGWNKRGLEAHNYNTTSLWKVLNSWWINILRDFWTTSAEDILAWNADFIISRVADNILSWKIANWPWYLNEIVNDIKWKALKPINNIDYDLDLAA